MTTPPADPQRVEQLRSDLMGAYGILTDVNAKLARHTELHAQHTSTLAQHTSTLAEHTARFEGLDIKLDRVLEILEAS